MRDFERTHHATCSALASPAPCTCDRPFFCGDCERYTKTPNHSCRQRREMDDAIRMDEEEESFITADDAFGREP